MTKGRPWDVVPHKDFHGDEQALQAAVEKGSMMVWLEEGVNFAGCCQTTTGVAKKVEDTHHLAREGQEVSAENFKALFNPCAPSLGPPRVPNCLVRTPNSSRANTETPRPHLTNFQPVQGRA